MNNTNATSLYRIESALSGMWEPFGPKPAPNSTHILYGQFLLERDEAVAALRRIANLSRIVWPVRAVSQGGFVAASYDPEQDTRLPGCRHRLVQQVAHRLWEAAGEPADAGDEFWLRAEQELLDTDGVTVS